MVKNLVLSLFSLFALTTSTSANPVDDAYINFAGSGGDFTSRTATFRVNDSTTVTPVGNGLRLYEMHLARMLEVSTHFCQDRMPDYQFYWNYEAEDGKVYMGQFSWTCQFAINTVEQFGSAETKKMTIHYVDNPIVEQIKVMNLDQQNAQEFIDLVKTLEPQCIDYSPNNICPGDRLK